ncbi:BAX inhibitor (BI)-1/YccA family protein [Erythrobacter arachoides]|uniref:BAX inhibitor (BI)-1/YccA family protein n=1 Tax=Aurantiacibacter arachoides TaxID=1850444 RepID=A0A845A010_9SPHN|nr:Bax inhibitor-1/YccA family protein [Aurantiacibacter arachoides]MXO92496.1 BAX inhibitor (BI)-1/YccA family protein [Aurantiacibacter arachoides]GGD56708.1 membrane protein [Aurantiacibacter arachoides]
MANWNENRTRQGFGTAPGQTGEVQTRTAFDAGLRKHMLSIYNYMASGVLLTGIVALFTARSGLALQFAQGPLMWLVMLSPLAIVFAMSFGRDKFSTGTLQMMFWAFAVLMGLSMSTIFLVYTASSIASTFFATAGAFAGLSLWGYTTKKDISGWGSFLIMGVIGLLVAMVINMIWPMPGLSLAISFIGVLIFAGLTAYDTQRLKQEYLMVSQAKMTNPAVAAAYPLGKMVIMGALSLYLDFINMFTFLLQFMGNRE